MPGLNWIPGVSQVKSLCQLVTGDVEGARQTQEDFFRECPGISQSVALGQAIAGDTEGAEETFRRGIGTVSNVANGIPIVGHVKSKCLRVSLTPYDQFFWDLRWCTPDMRRH